MEKKELIEAWYAFRTEWVSLHETTPEFADFMDWLLMTQPLESK